MHFSKYKINLILSKTNILEIISMFVSLKKNNLNFFGLCPFHNEKTPSFFVSELKQIYYCFGCKKFGNVINFLMEYKKINFISALIFLIKRKNIDINFNFINQKKYNTNLLDIKCLKKLGMTYHLNLMKLKDNNLFLKNFLKERCLDDEILKKFQIGYVDDCWDFITNKVRNNECITNCLIKLGVLIKNDEKNKIYDRFRKRIIFPIRNFYGDIVGFGGRLLSDEKPKYINSPESKIFSKKNELYGIYESSLNEKYLSVLIVEGYIDVLTLHKNGITNVVGILGSSFTIEHYKMLSKEYKKIIFCFDGDDAGFKAALRTAYYFILYSEKTFIGFVFFPKGEDPDSYIKRFGKDNFLKLIENPVYIFDYIFENLLKKINSNDLYGKICLLNEIKNLVKNIKDEDLKDFIFNYFKKKIYNQDLDDKKSKNLDLSLGMRSIFFLLENRSLINIIDINNIILNKNIDINSDLFSFLELSILLKKNIKVSSNELKIKMNKNFYLIEKKMKKFFYLTNKRCSMDEFLVLLNRIYNFEKEVL